MLGPWRSCGFQVVPDEKDIQSFSRCYRLVISANIKTLSSEFCMSTVLLSCLRCDSESIIKNGFIHNGKQNHLCKDCGWQFVQDPQNKIISDKTKALIDKLLLEKIPLAGIARVADVSEVWLQSYVNEKYAQVPRHVEVRAKKGALDPRM